MAVIETKDGPVDDAMLQVRRTDVHHEDGEYKAVVVTTEWCLLDCTGKAHRTGTPDSPGHFCAHHVKRDVAVNVITLPAGLSEIFQQLE